MARVELIMPKMGESIIEATILNWVKGVGDTVQEDETVLEIATDKVDSEIPSPVSGKITEILFEKDAVVPVGQVIAILETEGQPSSDGATSVPVAESTPTPTPKVSDTPAQSPAEAVSKSVHQAVQTAAPLPVVSSEDRFYSPLVKSIAKAEGLSQAELDQIPGTGANGRVNKNDIKAYLQRRGSSVQAPTQPAAQTVTHAAMAAPVMASANVSSTKSDGGGDEIIEMDRMRKLIANHMVMSKKTSPHVTSFVEVDVTNVVNWRNKIKNNYIAKYGEKLTFTPIFMEAVAKAITDFPLVNVSVEGDNIKVKKNINIGMATALPSGNLIVPVIKNANHLSLNGLATSVNNLAKKARENKLKPDDIQGGTFTLTNVGTFGNVMGTPIINQPQVAILAVGAIKKKPAVLETEYGDVIAIRHLMFCSLSYDHRVVDGFLGGSFLRKVGDYLEAFDPNRTI